MLATKVTLSLILTTILKSRRSYKGCTLSTVESELLISRSCASFGGSNYAVGAPHRQKKSKMSKISNLREVSHTSVPINLVFNLSKTLLRQKNSFARMSLCVSTLGAWKSCSETCDSKICYNASKTFTSTTVSSESCRSIISSWCAETSAT